MPRVQKISAAEAARWAEARHRTAAPSPAELAELLAALPDRRGLTRLDRAGGAGGEHGWRARVYTRGVELHRQFSDAVYGSTAAALLAAVGWRDSMRQIVGGRQAPAAHQPRVVRAEYKRMCGWLAYKRRKHKRYFADSAWGGRAAAEAQAWAWIREEE